MRPNDILEVSTITIIIIIPLSLSIYIYIERERYTHMCTSISKYVGCLGSNLPFEIEHAKLEILLIAIMYNNYT